MGGARTALYNWLWAQKEGGDFVLRIEDTDLARSERQFSEGIMDVLHWLGLDWDELYFQSERLPIYQNYVEKLVAAGKAYPCFCTPDELAKRRGKALARRATPEYDGHCRYLTSADRERYLREGRRAAIRFLVPEEAKTVSFLDFLRGEVRFRRLTTGDFVIWKSDGTPTYNLACVVDDHEMGVTHVLRAEDHLSNTPKQIWLYQALGWEPPAFGHLSMILGPDRHKLSKRHGATSVETLREQGFLPEAVANGLALLGWSPPTGEEVLTPPELVARFSLDRVVISPQVFDMDKLTWLNRKHLARLSGEEFFRRAVPYLDWLGHEVPEGKLIAALELVQPSLATLADLREHPDLVILFRRPALPAAARSLSFPKAQTALQEVLRRLPAPLRREDLRPIVQAIATELSLPTRDVFHPLRLALTGREEGPELAAICTILGTEEVRARIEAVLALGQ